MSDGAGATGPSPDVAPESTLPEHLELEFIAAHGSNGLTVDDDWIYYQSPLFARPGTYRIPNAVGTTAEPEKLGPYWGDNSGQLITNEGNDVLWATVSPQHPATLYLYRKDSGRLDEVNFDAYVLLAETHAAGDRALVLLNNCIGGFSVHRQTLEIELITREGAMERGGYSPTAILGEHLYCVDANELWRVPITGGEYEPLGEIDANVSDIFRWDAHTLLHVGGGQTDFGLVNVGQSPVLETLLVERENIAGGRAQYSPTHSMVSWVSRYSRNNYIQSYETDTWSSMLILLPPTSAPSNGIAQDADYLYWGETLSFVPTITRTKKLTYAEAAKKYFGVDWSPDPTVQAELAAKIAEATFIPDAGAPPNTIADAAVPGFAAPDGTATGDSYGATSDASAP